MMLRVGSAMGLKRRLIPLNVLTPKLSSYWLALFTPVPYSVASSLIEGLKSEVILTNNLRRQYFDFVSKTLEESVQIALKEIESNQVLSRWSDSGLGVWEIDHQHDIADALYMDRRTLPLGNNSPHEVYESFCKIGGNHGWFGYDWLWNLRGIIDKLFKGAGINRGRRDVNTLRIGDSVDFWKVVDIMPDERLLLFAQMKLPGKAWLEFKIHENTLIQTAYFYPIGVLGRLYWLILIPLHSLIFTNMIHTILKRSSK
ncbi:MAG: SDR family oxidoreductase, partial [Sulfurimonas sp.]